MLKLKEFAENSVKVTLKLRVLFLSEENIVRKGENAGYQHFLLFPQSFR